MMRFRHGPAWGRSRAADGNRQAPRRLVSDSQSFGGVMGKDKSILEKIADTMKDIANIAADAADHALKADEAPPKASERSAAYISLASDGLVSDSMMVPPIAAAHTPRSKRAALRRAAEASSKTRTTKAVGKKTATGRLRSAKTAARKTSGKTAKKARKGNRRTARSA